MCIGKFDFFSFDKIVSFLENVAFKMNLFFPKKQNLKENVIVLLLHQCLMLNTQTLF